MIDSSKELADICRKNKINMLLLYGSRASGNYSDHSDLDLGLILEDDQYQSADLINDLMEHFKDYTIDIAILNHSDPVFNFEIISNYKLLFCEDENIFFDYYTNTIKQYSDVKKFRRLEEIYLNNFIRGERDGIHKCTPPKVN